MLARSYLSAAQLKITQAERNALISVLGMLERNELIFVNALSVYDNIPNGFNMGHFWHNAACGTVGCIHGWAVHLSDKFVFPSIHTLNSDLVDLFMYGDSRRLTTSTEQAARGLLNYLTTGNADWDSVTGKSR